MAKVKSIQQFKPGDPAPENAVWKYSTEVKDGDETKIILGPGRRTTIHTESFITMNYFEVEIEIEDSNEQF